MKKVLCVLFGHIWENKNGQIVCKRYGAKK